MQSNGRGKPNLLLRKQRLLRGWSFRRVADELHKLCEQDNCKVAVDATMVWKWESGKHMPSSFYRDAFCRLYQLTADQLGFIDGATLTSPAETQAQSVTPSTEATSVEEISTRETVPKQLILPNGTLHVVTTHIHEQAASTTSAYPEQNDIIDTRMTPTLGQERPREIEDIVNRRDFNRKALGAAGTVVASDASIDSELLDRFHRALKKPSTIDATTLSYLRKRTANYYQDRHDASVASFNVLTYALDHFRKVTDLLEEPLFPTIRTHLTSIAGEIAQLIGELHFEVGNYPRARAYYKAAIKAAQEANNEALQAIALGWMSFAWTYSGEKQEALICIQEARCLAEGSANTTIRAWLAAVEAEIQANLDNLQACRKALDGAECADEQTHSLEASHWIHFDRSLLGGYQGICFLRLHRPGNTERSALLADAKHALTNALELLDPTLMRRQPTYLADLSSIYIRQGEIEEACDRTIQAIAIAVQIKSQMVTQRLLTLRYELEPWKNTQNVKNLDEHLAPLLISTLDRGNT